MTLRRVSFRAQLPESAEPAIQIGMTATPRETKYVSNIHYFGKPVLFMLSGRQGTRCNRCQRAGSQGARTALVIPAHAEMVQIWS